MIDSLGTRIWERKEGGEGGGGGDHVVILRNCGQKEGGKLAAHRSIRTTALQGRYLP